jgi:hypothetical protein
MKRVWKGVPDMESKILYFDAPGKISTDSTLKAARERAEALNIKHIVVASTHGYTAKKAAEIFRGMDVRIVAVSICASFDEEGWTMTPEQRKELEDSGVRVLTGLHALGDDVSDSFTDSSPNKVVREAFYRFCQGMKVAVEIALMAADAGALDMSREAISIGGTTEGADTAIVLKPSFSRKFRELEIREIIAKPRSGG